MGLYTAKNNKELASENRQTVGSHMLLLGGARSPFRGSGSFSRNFVGLDEDDIQMVLKQYNSAFNTYGKPPGIYSIVDVSEAMYIMIVHEERLQIECDVASMKTKFSLNRFGELFGVLRSDKESFCIIQLGFISSWVYKPTYAIHAGFARFYTSENIVISSTIVEIQIKYDATDGSVLYGVTEPMFFSFVSDKVPGYKVFCEPQTKH